MRTCRKKGIIFPNDYKKFINYYGTGGIDNFFDIFPKEKGILPCAYAENGDEVYWLTSKNEEAWEIKSQLIVVEIEKYFCSVKV